MSSLHNSNKRLPIPFPLLIALHDEIGASFWINLYSSWIYAVLYAKSIIDAGNHKQYHIFWLTEHITRQRSYGYLDIIYNGIDSIDLETMSPTSIWIKPVPIIAYGSGTSLMGKYYRLKTWYEIVHRNGNCVSLCLHSRNCMIMKFQSHTFNQLPVELNFLSNISWRQFKIYQNKHILSLLRHD